MPFRNPINRFPASQITGQVASDQIVNELIGKTLTGGLIRTGIPPTARWEFTDGPGLDGPSSRTIYAYSSVPHASPAGLTVTESGTGTIEFVRLTSSAQLPGGPTANILLYRNDNGLPQDPHVTASISGDVVQLNGDAQASGVRQVDSGWVGATLNSAGPFPDNFTAGPSLVFQCTRTGIAAFMVQAYFRVATAGAECAVDLVIRQGTVPFAGTEVFRQSVARSTVTTFMQIGGAVVATNLQPYGFGVRDYNATLSVNRTSGTGNVLIAKGQIGMIPSM